MRISVNKLGFSLVAFIILLIIISIFGCKATVRESRIVEKDTVNYSTHNNGPIEVKEGVIVSIPNNVTDTSVGITKYKSIKEVYDSQLGIREATGNNDGKEIAKYLKTVGLGEGFPYCAAGVKWCLLEAGYSQAKAINGMALSCDVKSRHVEIENLESGDVGTLYYARLGRIGHALFFDKKINSSTYRSVEFNTNVAGSRDGDGVYRKYRSYNATYSFNRWTK
ncbi:MAG: hypothetical protein ACEQSR_03795 [Candidatus Methylacidiphilales bacterium]